MEIKVQFRPGKKETLSNLMSVCQIHIPDLQTNQFLYLPYDYLHRYFGAPEGTLGDLLVFAGTCYVVDQAIPRALAEDRWTRELDVEIPVDSPDLWTSISSQLADTLTFLTGDSWRFKFTKRSVRIYKGRSRKLHRHRLLPASAVCLFSGGLDSLIGAVDYLATNPGNLVAVGHYGLGTVEKKVQTELAKQLTNSYPKRFQLVQARIGPVQSNSTSSKVYSEVPAYETENTFRSRSLVFLAMGVYVAQSNKSEEPAPLFIPENGLIAINPPLTASRISSCSTRTTHPRFVANFEQIVNLLGLNQTIANPLLSKTKGQAIALSSNRALLEELIPVTVSCAHPTRRQSWNRRNASHCGYCVPCILRRAALHSVGLDHGEEYGVDVLEGELSLSDAKAADLRAVLSWIYDANTEVSTPDSIIRRMTLPTEFVTDAKRVIELGIRELSNIVNDKATETIQEFIGTPYLL
jgi:7-cyano-7-deazaguanine synthase in queuosine biosynthesis